MLYVVNLLYANKNFLLTSFLLTTPDILPHSLPFHLMNGDVCVAAETAQWPSTVNCIHCCCFDSLIDSPVMNETWLWNGKTIHLCIMHTWRFHTVKLAEKCAIYAKFSSSRNSMNVHRCGRSRKRKNEKLNWHTTRGTRCTDDIWKKEVRDRWRLDQSNRYLPLC